MLRLKSFYLFLFSFFLLILFFPSAQKDMISYSLFAFITIILFFTSFSIRKMKKSPDKIESSTSMMWKRLNKNKTAMTGMYVLIILSYFAILAAFISPHDSLATDWGALSQGISKHHWLGTDDMGRDIFARNLFGIRVALGIGIARAETRQNQYRRDTIRHHMF